MLIELLIKLSCILHIFTYFYMFLHVFICFICFICFKKGDISVTIIRDTSVVGYDKKRPELTSKKEQHSSLKKIPPV